MLYVFNYTLHKHLESMGLNPIVDTESDENGTCINWKNRRNFWRYIKNKQLGEALKEWES